MIVTLRHNVVRLRGLANYLERVNCAATADDLRAIAAELDREADKMRNLQATLREAGL